MHSEGYVEHIQGDGLEDSEHEMRPRRENG